MIPSSGRVKLNRVALKDVIGLQLVPRRIRVSKSLNTAELPGTLQKTEHGQVVSVSDSPFLATNALVQPFSSEEMIPEIVTEASHNAPDGDTEGKSPSLPEIDHGGMEMNKRLGTGNDLGVKQEGPYSRGKYYQSRSNTRSKCRLERLSCNIRLQFAWCFCTDSANMLVKGKEVQRWPKPRGRPPKVSWKGKIKGAAPLAINKPIQSKRPSDQTSSGSMESSGRACKLRQWSNRETSVSCKVKGREEGGQGQSKVKARSTGCQFQTAAAEPERVLAGTQLPPTGLSNINRKGNAPPKPAGLAGSEGSVRRAVKAPDCGLCGGCKYIPSEWKKLSKEGPKTSPGPEQPRIECKAKKANATIQTPIFKTPKKIIIWIGKYPKVKLCDIAQICDACRQDCGYVLPDVLKTKVVHCSKRDLRAGIRIGPSCSGCDKHGSEEHALAYHSVQSEKSCFQSKSLTKHKKTHKATETFTTHTTCPSLEGQPSQASANCSASFLLGKRTSKGECRTGMLDRDIEEDPGAGSDLIAAEKRGVKRIKLWDSIRDWILPPNPALESISHSEPVKTDSGNKEEVESGMSVDSQSCLDSGVGSSNTFNTPVKKNISDKKPGGHKDDPVNNDAAQKSSELFSQKNEVGHNSDNSPEQLELFSCQRARVYFKQMYFSCARTYMSWPFPNNGLTPITCAGTEAHSTKPVYASPRDYVDTPVSQNQDSPDSLSERTSVMLSNAATDSSPGTNHQVSPHIKDEQGEDGVRQGREEEGEQIVAEKNMTGGINQLSYSLDSIGIEFASQFPETKEPLGKLTSEMTSLPSSPRKQREHGMDMISAPFLPSDGSETENHLSTPSPDPASTPSSLGLSDCEMATLPTFPLSSCTPDVDAVSATPPSLTSSFPLNYVDSGHTPPTSSSLNHMVEAMKNSLLYDETHVASSPFTSCCALSPSSDLFDSCESSLILSQEDQETEGEILTGWCPPKPEQHYNQSHFNDGLAAVIGKESSSFNSPTEQWSGINVRIPSPLLSPIASPQRHSITSLLHKVQNYSDEGEGGEEDKELPGDQIPQMVTEIIDQEDEEQGNEELEKVPSDFKIKASLTSGALKEAQSSPSNDEDLGDCNEEDSEDVEQGNINLGQVPSNPKIKATLTTGLLTEPNSSPSSDEDDGGSCNDEGQPQPSREAGTSLSETSASEKDNKSEVEAAEEFRLDEFTAYEQDILLVDIIEDDSDLFGNLPTKSLLKLGPTRILETSRARTIGEVKTLSPRTGISLLETEQSSTTQFSTIKPDLRLPVHSKEERNSRPWRPQCSGTPSRIHSNTWPPTEDQRDANNNHVRDASERGMVIQTMNSLHNTISPLMTMDLGNGPEIKNPANLTDFRRQKSSAVLMSNAASCLSSRNHQYCRNYFSETLCCGFKICRFKHVPIEGDEKFCVETVIRFTKNPLCLHKAGAVFIAYYQNNPPGAHFSMPVLISLLWALLKAGLISDAISVLNVSLTHKMMPGPEFLLALYNFVREKGLIAFVPELMQLTSKMAREGLVLSLDDIELVRTDQEQQTVYVNSSVPTSGNHKLSPSISICCPETLNLASAIVEIELCTKQKDWRRMGVVFRSICQFNQVPNDLERISGHIAVALLSETKDKLSLPFATFSEIVCQNENEDSLIQCFLGRIGVSLMVRYYKTHQWAKGRRVVEVLSRSKVSYSMLKGLFGNEDRVSRCCLVTMATELLLLSGSVEGALNTLRDNEWFLSSCSWPCEPGDLEKRSHVLMRLAEKTSHRDTLEVLSNLPGLKEPSDFIHVSKYSPLFNSHLQVCVDRQTLPVASDTADFMLSKKLAVNPTLLQILLHKLGKQNLWLRAREVFKRSLSVGYYPGVSAPPGFLALTVPCRLGEIELALSFEMFITVNATAILNLTEVSPCLSITLKRTHDCEREYLSAGSRLLSAAGIPQPKLTVRFTAVSSAREQVFILDTSSARRWLRSNHLWANEVWTHS